MIELPKPIYLLLISPILVALALTILGLMLVNVTADIYFWLKATVKEKKYET